jgi:hypothetical protein
MRPAVVMACIGALLVGCGWNVASVCDALVAVYQNGTVRQGIAITAFLLGIAACIAALVLMAKHPGRVIDSDFDNDIRRQMDRQF